MSRTTFTALLLATTFVAACETIGGGARDDEPGAPPPPVAYGGEITRLTAAQKDYQRPRLADEECLGYQLRRAKGAAGVDNRVKFAVLRDGSLARFSYDKPVTEEQARAIERAFDACRWNPGLDPEGRPIAIWVIQPIKIAGAPGE